MAILHYLLALLLYVARYMTIISEKNFEGILEADWENNGISNNFQRAEYFLHLLGAETTTVDKLCLKEQNSHSLPTGVLSFHSSKC